MHVHIITKDNNATGVCCNKTINISRIMNATIHIELTDTKSNGIKPPDEDRNDRNDRRTWY